MGGVRGPLGVYPLLQASCCGASCCCVWGLSVGVGWFVVVVVIWVYFCGRVSVLGVGFLGWVFFWLVLFVMILFFLGFPPPLSVCV